MNSSKIANVLLTEDNSSPENLNRILNDCSADYLCLTTEDIELSGELPSYLDSLLSDAGLIYGNYREIRGGESVVKKAYIGPEDITERADLGPLAIYNVDLLRQIGGWNPNLKFAYDYDLRLRMGELKALSYIPQVLCAQHIKDQPVNNSDKLYFPGKGKYGGFSYLYLQPDEEKEIETVFAESLRRRGAFLEGEAPLVPRQPLASPAVTIITPVFNRERFIGQAIESVLKGKFQNFEYIVIDNGSSDRTAEVVAKYTSDPRIRLVKYNENRIAKSLNIGVRNARGKYVAQLDSDDLYTEDTLNAMVEFMEQTHCALGISYYSLIDEEGNDLPEFGEIKHLEYSRNNILRVDGAGAVRMWRKSAIMQFGGFDEKDLCDYGEDYDLVLKVSEKFQVGRVHQVLYKYRRHPDNSDIKRNPLFKLRNKNLARERALGRRKILNSKT